MDDQEEPMDYQSAGNNGIPDSRLQTPAVGPRQEDTPQDMHQPMGQDGMDHPNQFQTSAEGPPHDPYRPPDTQQSMGQDKMEMDMYRDVANVSVSGEYRSVQDMGVTAITTQPTPGGPSSVYTSQQQSAEIQTWPLQHGRRETPILGEQNNQIQSTELSTAVSSSDVPAARQEESVSTVSQKHTTLPPQVEQDEKALKTQDSPDIAKLHVQVDCPDKEPPLKWEKNLEASLQTLFNKMNAEKYEIKNICFLDSYFSANITVSPSAAKQALLQLKSTTLTFKGIGEVPVHFKEALPAPHDSALMDTHQQMYSQKKPDEAQSSQEILMTVNAKVDLRKYDPKHQKELLRTFPQYRRDSNTLQIDGAFEDVAQFHKEFNEALGKPMTATSNWAATNDHMETSAAPLRVPVFQYWYLNHSQSKETERIQKNNGVKIKTDVCISFEESGATNTQACAAASQEFTDLFQTHATDIISVPVPGGYESVKNLVSLDPKLTLQMSSGTWSLIGPRASVYTVQKQWKSTTSLDESYPKRSEGRPLDPLPNNNLHGGSRWGGPKEIEMDIKDPLKTNGLCISHIHWELMKKAFEKQMKDIKNKYAVNFQETTSHGDVTVRAQSTGIQIPYLEMNALRALMSLYQKVVMSVMSCPLQNVSHHQKDSVKNYLDDINKQHPSLAVIDELSSSGVWRLIGLRDHLCFAISEIEEKLHGSAFDTKHKEMIGYEQTTAKFMRPFAVGTGSGIANSYKEDQWGKDTGFRGAHQDGFGRERGADGGYESHERDKIEVGSSVARSSSSFFESNGQKPGEARGMESGGYRMSGDGEKRAGSGEARHDDPRALIAGKDGGGSAEEENCPICMDEFTDKEKLSCGHGFCKDCLRQSVESLGATCPVCKKVFGKIEGDQPYGTMRHSIQKFPLPGFKRCDTIVINYHIPSGTQSSRHPKPGRPFHGADRTAYLPDNKEGREVLALLKRAFDQKLIFTVGTSRTSGYDDMVTWNDIHHKTNTSGGPQSFGYPDDDYLNRVKDELKAKGIE